jgi:hypothetical protein
MRNRETKENQREGVVAIIAVLGMGDGEWSQFSVLWFLLDLKHSYNIAKYIYHIIRSFCLFYR